MVPSENKTVEFEVLDDQGNPIEPMTHTVQVPGEEEIAENVLLRKRDTLRYLHQLVRMETRKAENARAQKSRTAKRRKKAKLQRTSRKKNRK